MGFNALWSIVDDESKKNKIRLPTAVLSDAWIIIDWNNFILGLTLRNGGHLKVGIDHIQKIFACILYSRFKICIVKDGKVDFERGVTKIERMNENLKKALANEREILDDFGVKLLLSDLYFEESEKILASDGTKRYFDMDSIPSALDANSRLIIHKADGEADPVIRRFSKDRSASGAHVIILSADGSLLLGMPEEIEICKPSDIELQSDQTIRLKTASLKLFIEEINRLEGRLTVDRTFHVDLVPYLEAILGRFHDNESTNDLPYKMILFALKFYGFEVYEENTFGTLRDKTICAVRILLWWKSIPDPSFNVVVTELLRVLSTSQPLTSQRLYGRTFLGNKSYWNFRSNTTTLFGINGSNCRKVAALVTRRVEKLLDKVPLRPTYTLKYGVWTEYDTPVDDTFVFLVPLLSLHSQLEVFLSKSSAGEPLVLSSVIAYNDTQLLCDWIRSTGFVKDLESDALVFDALKCFIGDCTFPSGKTIRTVAELYQVASTGRGFPSLASFAVPTPTNSGVAVHLHLEPASMRPFSLTKVSSLTFWNESSVSALNNLRVRQLLLHELGMEGRKLSPINGPDYVLHVLGLTNDKAVSEITAFWRTGLFVSAEHLSFPDPESAAKFCFATLYCFAALSSAYSNMNTKVVHLIEACLLSPLFVRGSGLHVAVEGALDDCKGRIKSFHAQILRLCSLDPAVMAKTSTGKTARTVALLELVLVHLRKMAASYDTSCALWWDPFGVWVSLLLTQQATEERHVYKNEGLVHYLAGGEGICIAGLADIMKEKVASLALSLLAILPGGVESEEYLGIVRDRISALTISENWDD